MEPPADDPLDDLLADGLAELEEHGPQALEAFCAAHPDHADELRRRLAALADAGLLDEPDRPPERLGEYRLGPRLGGGGMGVVYAAVQEPLGRDVALKVVRADQLYFPGARERFRREVRLVARLAHGAIVPVYAVGEEGGVPYFSMERLRGATVAEALALLDGPPARGADLARAVARVVEAREGRAPAVDGPIYAGDGVQAALTIGRRLAEALAHAHSRGVLHRDVKPSNLMLTVDGRALLFDFGLASSAQVSRLTRSGSRVGSLAYMAPEQARGEELDERGDVHGAGALLYELLAGRPPREGRAEAITAALLAGEPVDLAAARPGLPRDVVTVVETALAPDRAHRYASADDLARDLGHLLERRPIEARPAGPLLKALRWVQRHPARAAALALAVLLPSSLAIQQHLANRAVQEQYARAEANLEQALEALDVFVWELSSGPLQDSLMDEVELLALLDRAGASLEAIIAQRPDDVHVRCRWIQVQGAAAQCLVGQGALEAAAARLLPALELGRALDVDPAELASCHNALGLVRERQGDLSGALVSCEAALAGQQREQGFAGLCNRSALEANRARLLRHLGRPDEARAAADRARQLAEDGSGLAESPLATLRAGLRLTSSLNQLALAERALERPRPGDGPLGGAGRRVYRRALELVVALVERHPQRLDVGLESAALHINAPLFLEPDEALTVLERGLDRAAALVAVEPGQIEVLTQVLKLEDSLGNALDRLGRSEQAWGHRERAVALADQVLALAPGDLSLLAVAGTVDVARAGALVMAGRKAEACEPAARGAERLARAVAALGPRSDLVFSQAWAAIHEGYGRLERGEAERALERARAVPPTLVRDDPVVCVAVGELFAGCADLAGDPAAARDLRSQALDRLEQGLGLGFTAGDYLATAAEWAGCRDEPRFRAALAQLGTSLD